MSLVAYALSSDDESDYNDEEAQAGSSAEIVNSKKSITARSNGHISDEEEFAAVEVQEVAKPTTFSLLLPKPKHADECNTIMDKEVDEFITPAFNKLPLPRTADKQSSFIEDEDDEFLRKKASPMQSEDKQKLLTTRAPVKITIPSLKDFSDVDKERNSKVKISSEPSSKKLSGLLSILPKAKSEQNFAISSTAKKTNSNSSSGAVASGSIAFIPDTVKNRRSALNTENVDGIRTQPTNKPLKIQQKTKISLVDCSDSDVSEDESESAKDFFSLNVQEKLPEVSTNEINAMIAKKAAKMAEAQTKHYSAIEANDDNQRELQHNEEIHRVQKRNHEQQLDAEALQALVGNSGKRRRKHQEEIKIMDISSAEVLPNRNEWMRTALASSTSYQPTGVLVDEEPVAGTRRKHQITYLAHKAKANEAELQAMWAANHQNRRAASSKYGF